MKLTRYYLLFLGMLLAFPAFAQNKTVTRLEEVVLSDISLKRDSGERRVILLNDSILRENEPSLTSVLKFNSTIFFRENGPGMVSSASFRGTSAQQTAVIWNGININSQFTGQTDFNTIPTGIVNDVSLRPGGGSVLYGSGAIGGSVHLNNRFKFDGKFHNHLKLDYGSFETFSGIFKTVISSEKTSFQLNLIRKTSENDFEYPSDNQFNENGDFSNTGLGLSVAHRLNKDHLLKFHSNFYEGERGFSGTISAPSNSKYEDVNSRNLLEWSGFYGDLSSSLKLAYLDQTFRYYENRETKAHNFGRAKTGIAKIDLTYQFTQDLEVTGILEYQQIAGEGSNTGTNRRDIGSLAFLLKHSLGEFSYQLSARKEATEEYESPLLFAANGLYRFSENYEIRLGVSKNFRIPTFNDLYWYAGGNVDLKPETSRQIELGHQFSLNKLKLDLAGYFIDTRNLLRWIPTSGGLWRPENTGEVRNFGMEAGLDWNKSIDDHILDLSATYAWTHTQNQVTKKQLIYVPSHKATASLGYNYSRFSIFYQFLYNGSIFTSSDNNYTLDDYTISNLGIARNFGPNNFMKIGFQIRNIFDEKYMSMPGRPMPGRYFNSSITFKL
ncbi:MAG TPA: TonB-dependent receptor [Salegentibacter sp.]|uniref:TonB-dependent receptor plug domain-containing protein n=1 Tax=Salegentibacter sp. TaxID=1903072 RepID=UPI002F9548F1